MSRGLAPTPRRLWAVWDSTKRDQGRGDGKTCDLLLESFAMRAAVAYAKAHDNPDDPWTPNTPLHVIPFNAPADERPRTFVVGIDAIWIYNPHELHEEATT